MIQAKESVKKSKQYKNSWHFFVYEVQFYRTGA